jgi:SAM-dependent methyltransferase
MQIDASDLATFYESAVGQVTRRHLTRRIRLIWPSLGGERVLGYGFAVPYLRPFLAEADRVVALMPAHQGVVAWPGGRVLTCLGEENAFPFADAFFDRIVIVHGLEAAEASRPLMRQIWRVLAPSGRLLLVAPNRASLWAQVESSPFGQGRPFTRAQLQRLLSDSLFVAERWDRALYFPPLRTRRMIGSGRAWERFGRAMWPQLAGVHLVEATKSLYAVASPPERVAKRVTAPARS